MRRRNQRGRFRTVAALAVVAVVGGVGYLFYSGAGPLPDPEGCHVKVGEVQVDLDTDQAQNASTIAAIAVRRGLPARAVSIAIATAFQESKLRNVSHGDRDSLGLFQQRPSQGWGTREEIMDPYYSTNKFFDALVKIDGYQDMRITEAAQRVQRSGYPEAYEEHAAGARALASVLTGYSDARFSCVANTPGTGPTQLEDDGLTPRAEQVRADLEKAFGDLSLSYQGHGIDILERPVSVENTRRGWVIAQYLVANAKRLAISHVIFDDRIWTAGRTSEKGWRDYTSPEKAGDPAVLQHRDRVYVEVT